MSMLAEFQDRFAAALGASDGMPPAFAVYRNTVMKGAIDAIAANYPAVQRLVGEEWLRAAAAVFVAQSPPRTPVLVDYGAEFPAFLAAFTPADSLPYLADVARVDRFWTEAHIAADAAPLAADALAAFTPAQLAAAVLRPHPSARWRWFGDQPIHSLWSRNRDGASDCGDLAWHGEGVLVVRPHWTVEHMPLGAGACALLDACTAGHALGHAAEAALGADPAIDLSACLAQLLARGAFTAFPEATP